jgi:hypothetical protein
VDATDAGDNEHHELLEDSLEGLGD